jgi:methionyl-tRNA formyltransferase
MRIGYFADGPWAHEALDRILADGCLSLEFIVPRFVNPDPVLRDRAESAGIEFLPLANVNSPESLSKLAGFEADLFVSMSFDQIFRQDFLRLPLRGVINCHAGALPFYRGRNILNWALINGEKEFGVTVHYVDEGIDTGDIITQRFSPIRDIDDYGTLLGRAVTICADALHEAMQMIREGLVEPIEQSSIHPVGFYTGRRVDGDEWIDWSWPSRRVFNFVRAIAPPGPCARASVDGAVLKVVRAELIDQAPSYVATVGEVVCRTAGAVHVKTGDSVIALTDIEAPLGVSLRIGTRLQSASERREDELRQRIGALEELIAGLAQRTP